MPKPPPPPPDPVLIIDFESPDQDETFESTGSIDIRAVVEVDVGDDYGPPDVSFEVRPWPVDVTTPPTRSGKGTILPGSSNYTWVFNLDASGHYNISARATATNVVQPGGKTLHASESRQFHVKISAAQRRRW